MEQIQPIIIDENGTHRFLQNKIVDEVTHMKNNDIALYRYNSPEIPLDDFRQFNQLIGYSVGGFLSLSYCYRDGTYDSFYDEDYAMHIESLPVLESAEPPENHIIEGDEAPDFYRPNLVLVKVVKDFKINVEQYFNSSNYSLVDKRQFAQLLGYTVDEVERRFAKES